VRSAGGTAVFVQADLGTENEVRAIVERAVATYGRLDGAFNNAGLEQCAYRCTSSRRSNGSERCASI